MNDPLDLSERIRSQIADSSAKIRLGYPRWLRLFLHPDVIAITLGRYIFVSPRLVERGQDRVEAILRHELAHVRQVAKIGLLRFLFRYLRDYVRLRRQGLSSSAAYESIPFEIEARESEREEHLA